MQEVVADLMREGEPIPNRTGVLRKQDVEIVLGMNENRTAFFHHVVERLEMDCSAKVCGEILRIGANLIRQLGGNCPRVFLDLSLAKICRRYVVAKTISDAVASHVLHGLLLTTPPARSAHSIVIRIL